MRSINLSGSDLQVMLREAAGERYVRPRSETTEGCTTPSLVAVRCSDELSVFEGRHRHTSHESSRWIAAGGHEWRRATLVRSHSCRKRDSHEQLTLGRAASRERIGGLLAVVSEPAGIPGMRPEHRSQEDTRTYDNQVADSGWELAREHHETKPEQPSNNRSPPHGSCAMAVDARTVSTAKLGLA
jgi:hypothetical protein